MQEHPLPKKIKLGLSGKRHDPLRWALQHPASVFSRASRTSPRSAPQLDRSSPLLSTPVTVLLMQRGCRGKCSTGIWTDWSYGPSSKASRPGLSHTLDGQAGVYQQGLNQADSRHSVLFPPVQKLLHPRHQDTRLYVSETVIGLWLVPVNRLTSILKVCNVT